MSDSVQMNAIVSGSFQIWNAKPVVSTEKLSCRDFPSDCSAKRLEFNGFANVGINSFCGPDRPSLVSHFLTTFHFRTLH